MRDDINWHSRRVIMYEVVNVTTFLYRDIFTVLNAKVVTAAVNLSAK
jgi:hypothetical protein